MAELSGFEVAALVNEIARELAGSYENQIFKIGSSHLVRFRKPGSEDSWLVVSPKKGVWPSKNVKERGETVEFTTRLRRELERARFVGVRQPDLDRVFELDFEGGEKRTLVVELMPPGNLIVTGPEGRVLLAQAEVRTPSRRVTRGEFYVPPAQTRTSPTEVKAEAVAAMAAGEKTAGGAIGRHIALPRKYVSECLARLGLRDDSPSTALEGREGEVVGVLAGMVEEARDRPRPCLCETASGDEVFAFPPRGLKVKTSALTLSELCDGLFLREAESEPTPESPAEARRKEMEVTISRLKSESAARRSEARKLRAAAMDARSAPLSQATRIMKESGVKPAGEPTSPDSAASLLFDRAKELEAKAAAATESAERLEKRVPKAVARGAPRTTPLSQRRQEWYEKFRWFFTSGGKLAVGGRDAQTNSTLISRHMEDNDTVFHADLFGSPFFVLKGGGEQTEEEVAEVAQATVAFSSAWKTGLGSADAYWVKPEQVRTAAPSGEYLQRGSFAIAGKKNYVTKVLVEVAVGVDPAGRVISGPEGAVRARADRFLVLRPQREKGSDTAKRVVKDLGPQGGGLSPFGLDDVLRMLPAGGGKVIRRGTPARPR